MKHAVALRHVHFEDMGIFGSVLGDHGYALSYREPMLEDMESGGIDDADLLIVLGGPVGAFDEGLYPFLGRELALVRRRLEANKPILGVCLGAQLIARAMGASVNPMQSKEIGFYPLDLTEEGRRSVLSGIGSYPVLHWHGDQFDIPGGAVRLAGTKHCPNQAFSAGDSILALQFHLETDLSRFERWLVGHACELSQQGMDCRDLRREARKVGQEQVSEFRKIFSNWLDRLPAQ